MTADILAILASSDKWPVSLSPIKDQILQDLSTCLQDWDLNRNNLELEIGKAGFIKEAERIDAKGSPALQLFGVWTIAYLIQEDPGKSHLMFSFVSLSNAFLTLKDDYCAMAVEDVSLERLNKLLRGNNDQEFLIKIGREVADKIKAWIKMKGTYVRSFMPTVF